CIEDWCLDFTGIDVGHTDPVLFLFLATRPVPVSAEHRARILQPEDVAAAVLLACTLPPRARIPELVIVPTTQSFV
ncbi:MAG: hypothetical protein AAF497_02565, partial [Planctomycetota bacterium]